MQEFDEIYRLYFKRIYSFLLKLSANETIAEELTQETFCKAVTSIDKFRGQCNICSWLCRIAHNEYMNYIKKQPVLPLDDEMPSQNEHIEDIFERSDMVIRIRKVLHRLDEPYKEVFTLRVMGELKFSEIGDIFDKSEVWARVTYFRAKEKIIEKLEE